MDTSTVDKYEHNFGQLIVSLGISKGLVIFGKIQAMFLGGFFLLAGIHTVPDNIGGLLLIALGLGVLIPMLITFVKTPGARREVRIYEEGFVSIKGKMEESVHFTDISSIGHRLGGPGQVYAQLPTPIIRLKNKEKPLSIYMTLNGQRFDLFLKLGDAYAAWRFKDFEPEKLKAMNLSFGSRLMLKNSVFIYNVGRPRETTWHVSETQSVTINPKHLEFQVKKDGYLSIHIDKIENFHIIPYIVKRLNSL